MKLTHQQLDEMSDEELRYHLLTPDGQGKEKKEQMLDELLWREIEKAKQDYIST